MAEQVSYKDFAARVKAKYPEYKDVDDLALSKKIVEKYPEYAPIVLFDDKKKDDTVSEPLAESSTSGGLTTEQEPAIQEQQSEPVTTGEITQKEESTETGKALKSSSARALGGVMGLPSFVYDQVASLAIKPIARAFGATDAEVEGIAAGIKATPIASFSAAQSEETQAQLNKYAQGIESTMKQYEEGIVGSIRNGNYADAGEQLWLGAVQSLPYLAMTVATSGGGTPAVLTAIGTTSAAQRYGELVDKESPEGKKLSETGKFVNSWLYGGFEAAGEVVTAGLANAMKGAIKNIGKEAADEIGKGFAKGVLKSFALEGSSEAATELGQQASDYVQGLRDNIDMKAVGDAALIGGVTGGGIGVVTGSANSAARALAGRKVASDKDVEKVNDNNAKIVDLIAEKEKAESEEVSNIIDDEIQTAANDNKTIIEKNIETADKLSGEDIKRISDLDDAVRVYDERINTPSETENVELLKQIRKKLIQDKEAIIKDGIKREVGKVEEQTPEMQEQLDYLKERGVEIPDGTNAEQLAKLYEKVSQERQKEATTAETVIEPLSQKEDELATEEPRVEESRITAFHGTSKTSAEKVRDEKFGDLKRKWMWVTENEEESKRFGEEVVEISYPANAKVFDGDVIDMQYLRENKFNTEEDAYESLRKQGYDIISFQKGLNKLILNNNILKTKKDGKEVQERTTVLGQEPENKVTEGSEKKTEAGAAEAEVVPAFKVLENEGEWSVVSNTYKGRNIANFVSPFLDKAAKREYDKLRDKNEGVFVSKEEAAAMQMEMDVFEKKHKSAFEKAKADIDNFREEFKPIGKKGIKPTETTQSLVEPLSPEKGVSVPAKEKVAEKGEKTFKTSKGEIVSGEKLKSALNKVADDWAELQRAIRKEDKYAPHVTEKEKDDALAKGLETAEQIRKGEKSNEFWAWQRINAELTGETVGFLPPSESPSITPEKPRVEEIPQAEEKKIVAATSVKPKNLRDVYRAMRGVFNLEPEQAKAAAIITDKVVDKIAKSRGVEKSVVYGEMEYKKSDKVDIAAPQGAKAAFSVEDGVNILHALTDPNVSSPLHELAHMYERYMDTKERAAVLRWTKQKKWNLNTSEQFARGFEKYLADGKSPNADLRRVFERFKKWMLDIYNGITGSEIDLELNEEMRGLYDQMLGVKGKVEKSTGKRYESRKKTIDEADAEVNSIRELANANPLSLLKMLDRFGITKRKC